MERHSDPSFLWMCVFLCSYHCLPSRNTFYHGKSIVFIQKFSSSLFFVPNLFKNITHYVFPSITLKKKRKMTQTQGEHAVRNYRLNASYERYF